MSESLEPIPPETEEALCLYVLDLLPGEQRAALEMQLAAEPHLRRAVREFQGSLEGWVQSLPQRSAPLQVWGRIAATIRSAEAPVFATRTTAMERRGWAWGWQAFGAAACLLAGMGFQAWRAQGPAAPVGTQRLVASPGGPLAPGSRGVVADPTAGAGSQGMASGAGGDSREATASKTAPSDASRAGAGPTHAVATSREKVLQSQVTVLTELLNRELGTLPGASKLQVVRLLGPGESADASTLPALDSNMLAALALSLLNQQQKASVSRTATATGPQNGVNSDPQTGTPALTSSESTTTSTAATVPGVPPLAANLTGASLAATASPVGSPKASRSDNAGTTLAAAAIETLTVTQNGGTVSFAPIQSASGADHVVAVSPTKNVAAPVPVAVGADSAAVPTGVMLVLPQESTGTAVISNPNPLTASEVYQFWQMDPATGITSSLGTARSEAATAIFNFNLPEGRSANTSLFITREPTGGSKVPTGPVVVSTPAPKP